MARKKTENTTAGLLSESVTATASSITVVPITDLILDPANLRKRDTRARATLRGSIARFGAARSVVLDANNVIRAGNGTIESGIEEGYTEVLIVEPGPGQMVAVKRSDWSPTEATGYSISDNRLSDLSTFDETALAETLRALQSEDFPTESLGYTGDEVNWLCDKLARDIEQANGDVVDDPQGEWEGMPAFEHQDLEPTRTLFIHFKTKEDVQAFAKLVGQPITDKTKCLWHPKTEIIHHGEAE